MISLLNSMSRNPLWDVAVVNSFDTVDEPKWSFLLSAPTRQLPRLTAIERSNIRSHCGSISVDAASSASAIPVTPVNDSPLSDPALLSLIITPEG